MSTYKHLITLDPADPSHEACVHWASNGKMIGFIYREVDGYFVYQPNKISGCFSSIALRAIAEHLSSLNEQYAEECDNLLAKPSK